MSRRQISGSRTIVTGASSGIGWALAHQLARRGARLVLTARREDRLRQLAAEIDGDERKCVIVPGDITDPDLRARLIRTAVERWGGLDILVNNAGVGALGPFRNADPARLRRVMEVNFFAPVELIRSAIPALQNGHRAIVVNIGSVLGHRAVPKKSEYCASKFALHGFSDALRAELVSAGIDVLLVSPSTTHTEFFDVIGANQRQLPWLKFGGMKADRVAAKTVRAIAIGRHEIILSAGGKLLVWLDRISPPLVNRLVARFG
jgi:short-subunit dehydrogenase